MKTSILQYMVVSMILVMLSCSGNTQQEKNLGLWQIEIKNTPWGDLKGLITLEKSGSEYTGQLTYDEGSVTLTGISFNKNEFNSGFYFDEVYLSLSGNFEGDAFEGEISGETLKTGIYSEDTGLIYTVYGTRVDMEKVNQAPVASITVNKGAPSKPYSPMIFGGFLEHFGKQVYGGIYDPGSALSNDQGFRMDVIEALKELKIPVVRWPGGSFVSGYHWELGVGSNRQPTDDMVWGVIEPNTFGTDEFIDFCRVLGAEPFICTNAGNGTIEEMRNWVEYTNGTQGKYAQMRKENGFTDPHNVEIWSIGNENYGHWEIGQKSVEEWGPLVSKAAKEMKAVDPDIQLSAAAVPNKKWTLPLLETAGPMLDYVSIHAYWLPLWRRDNMPDYMTGIIKSEEPENLITYYLDILEEAGFRKDIKIALDEWNLRGWHHPGFARKTVQDYNDPKVISLIAARDKNLIASQYTMADALFSASFFNACLRHAEDIAMANIAPLVNTRGPLFVHPDGIVKRTHFHPMAMYANMLGDRVVDAQIDANSLHHAGQSIPVIDGVVTSDDEGETWSIALVNRHPSMEGECTISIHGKLLEGDFNATILSGDSPEAYNSIENPDRVVPGVAQLEFEKGIAMLPPHSLTILKVSGI